MTDDASPENLRKFLESDDPALVRMGISLAKGAGVEMTVKDLMHFLQSEDAETIKMGFTLAEEAGIGDEAMAEFVHTLELVCERVIEERDNLEYPSHQYQPIVDAIIQIGSQKAIEPLLRALDSGIEGEDWFLPELAAEALTGLGWKPETDEQKASYLIATKDWEGCKETGEPLVTKAVQYIVPQVYIYHGFGSVMCQRAYRNVINAAHSFGAAAVKPFIKEIEYDIDSASVLAEELGEIGDERAVEPLIKVLEDGNEYVRGAAAEALGKIGDARAVEPLIKALGDETVYRILPPPDKRVREAAKEALKKLGHEVE